MSFIYDVSERFYKEVAASTTETSDYIPSDGEKLFIVNAGLSSSSAPETVVHICWDPGGDDEVIISSYGEAYHRELNVNKTGDGIKIMRISLVNDLTEPSFLGGFWQAVINL